MAEAKYNDDTKPVWEKDSFKELSKEAEEVSKLNLRELLSGDKDDNKSDRRDKLMIKTDEITLDCTRQQARIGTVEKLINLAKEVKLGEKIKGMFNGDKINITENRSVLHVALRANKGDEYKVGDKNVVDDVLAVRKQIEDFSKKVRCGEWKGYSGKELINVVSIGIGGSYLGAEFVFQALKTDPAARKAAKGRQLRFYANIDPIGFARATAVKF